MKVVKFQDLIAWQKAQELAVVIYKQFGQSRDFGFKDQICRVVVSISNNIAEGFDRNSNKEFTRFLYIALGSNSEVKSMLYLAEKLAYLDNDRKDELVESSNEISKILRGLIKSINK